jgi:hypothetical protein
MGTTESQVIIRESTVSSTSSATYGLLLGLMITENRLRNPVCAVANGDKSFQLPHSYEITVLCVERSRLRNPKVRNALKTCSRSKSAVSHNHELRR